METSVTGTLDLLIKNPILIVGYFAVLLYVSWQMTLFTILFAPLMIWVMGVIGRKLKEKSLEAQALWSDTMSQVDETLGGLRVIKAFLGEKKMSRRFDAVTEAMKVRNTRVATRQAAAHPVSECLGTVMIAVVLWFGGTQILKADAPIDAPTFIFFLVMLYSVIQPIKDLSKAAYSIPKGMASMERINRILDSESDIREAAEPVSISGFEHSIEFKGVGFAYSDSPRKVLEGIDLKISKGQTVAIVGASGAGKSTLVDLIPRFHDVREGSITIDGVDIRDIRIRDLRALMGNVDQDPVLFNDTIFNNIAFGVEGATAEQVMEAAGIANAHDFIMEKEKGYDTNVGDRGCKLSGGQRQRISIARALLKHPKILILDDSTSAVDTATDSRIRETFATRIPGVTKIIVSQRILSLKDADRIIVMEQGRINGFDTHENLLRDNEIYRDIHEMQTSGGEGDFDEAAKKEVKA